MGEKERYATTGKWAEVFREEGFEISHTTIRKRLEEALIVGKTARSKNGQILRNAFFAESDVRRLVANIFKKLPQADENGFFELNGITYGNLASMSRLFRISPSAIRSRIQDHGLESIEGKTVRGFRDFYPLPAAKKICADLVTEIPQADENGLFELNGVTYGTINSLTQPLNLSKTAIGLRIQRSSLEPIKGKDKKGSPQNYYSLPAVKQLCADLLAELPQADENGLFELNGVTYGTIKSLADLLGLYQKPFRSRVRKNSLKAIKGKNRYGQVRDFYSESEARRVCADLIHKRKK